MKTKLRILAILLLSAVLLTSCSVTVDEIKDAARMTEELRLTGSQVYRPVGEDKNPEIEFCGGVMNLGTHNIFWLQHGKGAFFRRIEPGLPRIEKWNPLLPFVEMTSNDIQ